MTSISRLSLKVRIDYQSLLNEYCKDVEDEHRREPGQAATGQDNDRREAQKKLEKEAQLEQVYMGARMIYVAFPDVAEIEESVLNEFRRLASEKSPATDY